MLVDEKIIKMCKNYVNSLNDDEWPTETLKINRFSTLQIWRDKNINCAAIRENVDRNTWFFIHRKAK